MYGNSVDEPSGSVESSSNTQESNPSSEAQFGIEIPSINLPKGGGAIRGIGEKFAANPVTGTGSMSIPIAISPGRGDFSPQLSLSYDSGSGNGPFGFGWSLSIPSIQRKTDKGLPLYQDEIESDVFLLSGAEDLVPLFDREGTQFKDDSTIPDYTIHRYRPRVEGLFARIERWTHTTGDVHWRSISKDNILTIYGKDTDSRIFNPQDQSQIFSWLICETRDDKGNVIIYEYKNDNGVGVDLSNVHERNRGDLDDERRETNRYIKRILYGNQHTLLESGERPLFLSDAQLIAAHWMFEVAFDYGEHDASAPTPNDLGEWSFRADPFSNYRPGFEVRTTRLCQRVLMFHHVPADGSLHDGYDGLVRSTDFTYSHVQSPEDASNPIYTFLKRVAQIGYKKKGTEYLSRSMPPVDFDYSQVEVQQRVEKIDPESLTNLPIGVDGARYQWRDLHGEGIPGIISEQAGTWLYKRNQSPITETRLGDDVFVQTQLAATETVKTKPNTSMASGAQFMDLTGNGQLDLVTLDSPIAGFYEHDLQEGWHNFKTLKSRLNREMNDPNLKFIDLDGDGLADVFITENEANIWHASLADAGFGPARRTIKALDEELGPRVVFADGTQSIYLADLSGDGLTDIARIRNSEVCYWPNLGYGKFGAKVTMDNSPHFDHIDQFDQKRIRLADIDGSGTIDIIYLHRDGIHLYFNQSGNAWSEPEVLVVAPRNDELVNIVPTDLLGNGTACLVWSSPLPADSTHPMRYINLIGGQKPHLLIKSDNNLGGQTEVQYTPSTKFYLQDKLEGKPWITKLPFPVHVVEKVIVTDKWREARFATSYSYHHGYFDGVEREFRGFGRVDQVDVETFSEFAAGNTDSPHIDDDQALYEPPIKTITWFHTGALLDQKRILSHYESEYFPNWLKEQDPRNLNVLGDFSENDLPEPDVLSADLTPDERREATRACKGMMLRQEIYELDVDTLEAGEHRPVKLFSTAYHNCNIQCLQSKGENKHAVFLVTESEAINYHYELDLRAEILMPNPRIAHTLNLNIDKYGNVLQAVSVGYPRLGSFVDVDLSDDEEGLINSVQDVLHLVYSETRFTNDINEDSNYTDYRLPLPYEVLTYELGGDRLGIDGYYSIEGLREFQLSSFYPTSGIEVTPIHYHQNLNHNDEQKRLVEHVKMLYFNTNLEHHLEFGEANHLALPYQTYKLALTDLLLDAVFDDKHDPIRGDLDNATLSGYLSGRELRAELGDGTEGQYWIRSGIVGFAEEAAKNYYLPERYIDAFGNITKIEFDNLNLFMQSSTDPAENTVAIDRFDPRVLAPSRLKDINDNITEVVFDVLAFPTAVAVKGKHDDASDRLSEFDDTLIQPELDTQIQFFTKPRDPTTQTIEQYQQAQHNEARHWLDHATARNLYYFGEVIDDIGGEHVTRWGVNPASSCSILRETHVIDEAGTPSALQISFEYSDGSGNVLVTKVQAEPKNEGGPSRWIGNRKTILNNKGKPIKQYEPYFSENPVVEPSHLFEEPAGVGVTPIMYYDAPGRLIRTEFPDGSYSKVEFTPWQVKSFDQNDTVASSQWYADRDPLDPEQPLPRTITGEINATPEQQAAWLSMLHKDTPAVTMLDSLGRDVIAIAHNRVLDNAGDFIHGGQRYTDEKHLTFTKLDAEGKPLWIRDARRNLVMQYITPTKPTRADDEPDPDNPELMPFDSVPSYDIAGNLLYQHSMDGGDRWMIMDATGQPFYAWDKNENTVGELEERVYHTRYDDLRRPIEQKLAIGADQWTVERFIYGDEPDLFAPRPVAEVPEENERNLRGQIYQHYDSSGLITNEEFDFKGNLLNAKRRLASDYQAEVIGWPESPHISAFEEQIFDLTIQYDALSRMIQQKNWHLENREPATYTPQYNQRGVLISENLTVHPSATAPVTPGTNTDAIRKIEYNEKGQRTSIEYGNDTETTYEYESQTFRLIKLQTRNKLTASILQDLSYTYDPVGNITEIRDNAQQIHYFDNHRIETYSSYIYDALYRLIQATGREHAAQNNGQRDNMPFNPITQIPDPNSPEALQRYTEDYKYDSVGNILSMKHSGGRVLRWKRCYQYAQDSNRLLATGKPGDLPSPDSPCPNHYVTTPTLANRYEYDTHGSMLNFNRTAEEYRPRWDYRDMIHTVHLGGGGIAWYNYDSQKQRTRKRIERIGGFVEERFYLGGMEWYRKTDSSGNVKEEIETYHLFADDQRVLLVENVITSDRDPPDTSLPEGFLFRYHYSNHLGSVSLELDEDAKIITYEEYHPYGTTAYQAKNKDIKAANKRYRYTGMERDEETGLSYHTARYYLPGLGRWLSADPIGVEGGMNFYGYVGGRVVTGIDIEGKQEVDVTHITQVENLPSIAAEGLQASNNSRNWLGSGVYFNEQESPFTSISNGSRVEGSAVLGTRINTEGFVRISNEEWHRVEGRFLARAAEQLREGGSEGATPRAIASRARELMHTYWNNRFQRQNVPGAVLEWSSGEDSGNIYVVRDTNRIRSEYTIQGQVVRNPSGTRSRPFRINSAVKGFLFRSAATGATLALAESIIPGLSEARYFVQSGGFEYTRQLLREVVRRAPPPPRTTTPGFLQGLINVLFRGAFPVVYLPDEMLPSNNGGGA